MPDKNYEAEVDELEQRAEEHAPGVLELLDVYARAVPPEDGRQVASDYVIRQASGTTSSSLKPLRFN